MIARIWTGSVRTPDADEYADYIRDTGFAGEDIEAAVLYPEDERYLMDGASTIAHYDVADAIPGGH